MNPVNPASPTAAAAGLRRVDDVIVSLLCMLLPAGFRARQRGEWAADLTVLTQGNPRARWRYLIGAARTLPSLRSSISRRRLTIPALDGRWPRNRFSATLNCGTRCNSW